MVTEKYCAGLVDSDGYIGLGVNKKVDGTFTVSARVTIKQRNDRSKVLTLIAEQWGIKVYDDLDNHCIVFSGNKARRFLESIKNHLVIKPDVAEFVLSSTPVVCSETELKELKNQFKKVRSTPTSRVKNYPSRKWLAGYFDGDGSLQVAKNGCIKLQFTCHINERVALDLIHKAFGGSINTSGNVAKLYISIPYRYAKNDIGRVIGYFGKHSVIKQSQVQYVLGHAGSVPVEQLYTRLKQLKQPASTKRETSLQG